MKRKVKPKQMTLFDLSEVKKEPATRLMKAVALKAPNKKKIEHDFSKEEVVELKEKYKKEQEENSQTARDRREKIIRIKSIAKDMEKGNRSKIIIFPSYSRKSDKLEWYKMGNFSALYYVYRMADRMGKTARLRYDTDKFAKMHDGVVSIKNVEQFVNRAMLLNEFERSEETLDGIIILYLKSPLSDTELAILRQSQERRREMMHNVLRPKKADAKVYQAILTIDRQVLPRAAKMPRGYYQTIGENMVRQIMELTQTYFGMADGYVEPEVAKKKLLWLVEGIKAGATLLGENSVWAYDVTVAVGENVEILKKSIEEMK